MRRYSQDTSAPSLSLEPPQSSQILNLFNSSGLSSPGSFNQDGGAFYHHPHSGVFTSLDVRARLPSSNTASTAGMAHTHSHRNAPLPHPGPHISTRDQYSPATPSFKRASEHLSRSPSYSGTAVRRNPLSPTSSQLSGFTTSAGRIEATQYANRASTNTIPPLLNIQLFGALNYGDAGLTPVKVDIHGVIDKGFFIASDGEWTCYRRNYFTCVCSYSLSPYFAGASIQFTPQHSVQPLQLYGFAMSISAVVAENDQHGIDLVQHTPKRDKGPTGKPDKVPLGPKQGMSAHHPLSLYGDGSSMPGTRLFADGYGGPQGSGPAIATEHTFERIQFKQATQNNGKRRAAQQYYHLVVELWGNTGSQTADGFVKVASRKSAKMIVRGRSPGHYQNDRRGSQSSGPGGSAGTMGGYGGLAAVNSDFTPGTILGAATPSYGGGFDGRGTIYGGGRHHDIPAEVMIPPEEEKAIESTKAYRYYPGTIYPDQSDHIDMFQHRNENETQLPHMGTEVDMKPKITDSYDISNLTRQARPPPLMAGQRRCGPFEGKPDSAGYYPTMMASSGANTTIS
ncbi:Meiosis-specific transcription factor [Paramyrothecium foliicola]|nr:Meiosis-specific transcription factor [Paramyrothecium foliicola]